MLIQKKHIPILLLTIAFGCNSNTKTTSVKTTEPAKTNESAKKQEVTSKNTPVKAVTVPTTVEMPAADTTQVLAAFKELVKTDRFLKEMSLQKGETEGEITTDERPVLIGDLNGDGLNDALMPFQLIGRDGGNNWTAHTAVFINNGKNLEYKFTYDRGGDMAETALDFTALKDGVITGLISTNNYSKKKIKQEKYSYKNNDLILLKK